MAKTRASAVSGVGEEIGICEVCRAGQRFESMSRKEALVWIVGYAFGLLVTTGPTARSMIRIEAGQLGNLFLTNETVQIPVKCDGREIRWRVTDYFGSSIETGMSVPENGSVVIRPFVKAVGYFDLTLTELNDGVETSTLTTSFGIITPIDISAMAESPFGVTTHFAQFHDQSVICLIARAGIRHFRDEQYWAHIEQQKGVFTFPAKFSDYMSKAKAASITPLIALTWSNQFYDWDAGVFTDHTPAKGG